MLELSVIIPVYNGEKYLSLSLESILNQTYQDFELIIINDGSTDGSEAIILDYAKTDQRIKFISRDNRGLVMSLNEGISIAKGKYLARMDADDISNPTRFEKQLRYLKENKVDILGTCVEVIGDITEAEKTRHEQRLNISFAKNNSAQMILTYWYCLAHPTVMMRNAIFKTLQGYNQRYAEDLDLWLRAIKQGYQIAKLDEQLLKYRVHSISKTVNDNKEFKGIRDGINLKLEYVFGGKSSGPGNYLIWGTGNGGRISKEMLEQTYPKANCCGYIDPFINGQLDGTTIYAPAELKNVDFDYIFVATEPGKNAAITFLNNLGLVNLLNYLCTI